MNFSYRDPKMTLRAFSNRMLRQWTSSSEELRLYEYLLDLNPESDQYETPFNALIDLEIIRATRANQISTKLNEWGLIANLDYIHQEGGLIMLTRAAVIHVINYYNESFGSEYAHTLERIAYAYGRYEEAWDQMNEMDSSDSSDNESECSDEDSNPTIASDIESNRLERIDYHAEVAHDFIRTMHGYVRDVKMLASTAVYVIGFAMFIRVMDVRAGDVVGAIRNMLG